MIQRILCVATAAVLVVFLPTMQAPEAAQTIEKVPPAQPPAEFTFGYATDSAGKIRQVLVYRNGKQIQALDSCTGSNVPHEAGLGDLQQEDFNFDRYPDLMMRVELDPRLDNSKYCVWLFNPKRQTYVLSDEHSRLTNPQPIAGDHTVVAQKNLLCSERCYDRTTYRWLQGSLKPVREESLTEDPVVSPVSNCRFVQSMTVEKKGTLVETSRQRVDTSGVMCEPHPDWD